MNLRSRKQAVLWVAVGVLAVAGVVAVAFFPAKLATLGGEHRGISVERLADARPEAYNLTREEGLREVPELVRALDEAADKRWGGVSGTAAIDRTCRFLEKRFGLCGGILWFDGLFFDVGLIET